MVPWWRLGSIQCFFDLDIILLVTEGPSFHSSTRTHLLTITIITEGRAVLSGLRPFQRSPATSICVYLRVCKISIFLLRWKRRWVQRVATTGWEKEDFKTINPKKQVNITHTHTQTHTRTGQLQIRTHSSDDALTRHLCTHSTWKCFSFAFFPPPLTRWFYISNPSGFNPGHNRLI